MPSPKFFEGDFSRPKVEEPDQLSLPETEFTGELLPWANPNIKVRPEIKEPSELEQLQESAGVNIPVSITPRVDAIMEQAARAVDSMFAQGDTNEVLARRRAARQVGESALSSDDIEQNEKRQDAQLRSARRLHEPKAKRSRRPTGDGPQTQIAASDLRITSRSRTPAEIVELKRGFAEGIGKALQAEHEDEGPQAA